MQQHAQQSIAVTFASGEHAYAFENIISGKQKTAEQVAQIGFARRWRYAAEIIENARLLVQLFVLVLRKIIALNVMPDVVLAACQRLDSGKQLDQRRLPCSIHADQGNAV